MATLCGFPGAIRRAFWESRSNPRATVAAHQPHRRRCRQGSSGSSCLASADGTSFRRFLMPDSRLTVMGSFVADLAFRTPHLPAWGETVMGSEFRLGPGGKGSNQAVAAARLGGKVTFISKLGRDPFGEMARRTYLEEGI